MMNTIPPVQVSSFPYNQISDDGMEQSQSLIGNNNALGNLQFLRLCFNQFSNETLQAKLNCNRIYTFLNACERN